MLFWYLCTGSMWDTTPLRDTEANSNNKITISLDASPEHLTNCEEWDKIFQGSS